jgi:hypothetical protein
VRATELIAAVSLAVDIGMAQPLETGLAGPGGMIPASGRSFSLPW